MLYIFKSRNCPDLIMLEPNGRRLLEIIGKEVAPTGIITPEQMPAAARSLSDAIARDEEALRAARAAPELQGEGGSASAAHADGVTLKQRLLPMIEMLGRCEKARCDITWGV